ncbi:unnamed protein product, partial [Hymenolepis diminuta]
MKILSLQETVSKLTAEKETLKSLISLEGKMNQYAKDYYAEQSCTFERIKQKIENLVCTVESTMATAEQSGELFNRLRKVLNEVNKLKDVENREEKITLIENSTEQEPTVVEPDIAMDGPLNLSEVLSEKNVC